MDKSFIGLDFIKPRWKEANDAEREQILLDLKQQGLSIGDVILALARSGFLSLGEAKEYVSASPAWQVQVENSRELQEIAWEVVENSDSPDDIVTITEKPYPAK